MRAEGFGVVVLERIGEAIANADAVRADIRLNGSNQECYEEAGIAMDSTRFYGPPGTGYRSSFLQSRELCKLPLRVSAHRRDREPGQLKGKRP